METDGARPLLLLIDLQRDYLSAPRLEPAADAIVRRAAVLLEQFRSRNIPVAHVWTTVSRDSDNRMPHWKQAGRWQCEAGTPGHRTSPELAPLPSETIISKSAFSGFTSEQLDQLIRSRNINTVVLAGVHLHACVRQTALDAYQKGLAVWIAEDAVGSDDPVHAAITRRYLEARAMRFAPAITLPEFLSRSKPPTMAVGNLVGNAVEQAQKALLIQRATTLETRVAWLGSLAAALNGAAPELAESITRETGKPIRFSRVEVQRSADMLRAISKRARAHAQPADAQTTPLIRRRPHGIVAVVTPWNNPIYIALGKIAPAIVYGNAVAWKPAPEARNLSRQLSELFIRAGWPEGLVARIDGDRRAAAQLMAHDSIAAATLTGSCAAGHSAQEICARRHIPLQAELGGNNAAIIWPDADLAQAARAVAAGAFEMAGQRCTANRRVIVHENCRREFVELLRRETTALHWGDPMLPDTQIGPVIGAAQRERIAETVARAVAKFGPPLLPLGGRLPDLPGHWSPPTILFADDPGAEIVQEETFGPVLVVSTAADWDRAISHCNGVRQGLAAAIFTRSPETTERFLAEAEAGILKVNRPTSDAEVDVPFGGWKSSGIGPPEHGAFDLDFYTRPQTVYR